MKTIKAVLILIILFVSLQICFGQDEPKAMLVDEFSKLPCDDFLARMDNLAVALSNEPNSKAYVITFGEKNQNLDNFRYEQLLKNSLISLRRDESRYVFVHGKNQENLTVQFWIVPDGAEKPQYAEGNWNYEIEVKKPFIVQQTNSEDTNICPLFPNTELYSKFFIG